MPPITIPQHDPIKRVYVEEIRKIIEEDETIEYSGQFKLRMPKSLHRSLSINAKREGISMNQYCNYLLAMNDAKHSQASTLIS
ncbi:MAG: toxin-antitoxin system HicB family antitoxin [Lachnospiraceae bacterium]|nr:toxin-antitoxin system HicB family antitoxin [Lachnospiraceae bacterium]